MIPYSYNMVDMGGIDLSEANGTIVEGLYNRLALARNACGDLILFNWKFAGIEIAPSACSTIDEGSSIVINGVIQVTDEDVVTITSLTPPLEELTATQNNEEYYPREGFYGFSKVIVSIPPTLVLLISVQGGYNGGAVLTISYDNEIIFSATGDSPYNLAYTPNSASLVVAGESCTIEIPNLSSNLSLLNVNIELGGVSKSASFMYQGANTSYGYGNQSQFIVF